MPVRLVSAGVILMCGGLLVLLAMTARWIAPELVSALAAYASAFGGLLLAVFGTVRKIRGR